MTPLNYLSGAISPGDCIGGGWNLVSRRFGLYLGVGLITMLLISCVPIVNFFLMGPVLGGFYLLVLRDMRDEPAEFGDLFKGFEKFVPLMVVGLVQAIPGIVFQFLQWGIDIGRLVSRGSGGPDFFQDSGSPFPLAEGITTLIIIAFIVIFIFSILWAITFHFAIAIMADNDVTIGEALKLSAQAGWSNIGGLIVLFILEGLVGLLGVLALCVGIFVAIPVVYAANAFAYRQVFPYLDKSNFNVNPPPPSEYGGTYGTNY